jgi:LPXTG-site transpeptidase (sortase) family protein
MAGMWLEIPSLELSMPLTGVPLTSTGWNLTWLSNQAGYLQGTTYPGRVGNTALTGHVYLSNGAPGPFVNLGKLYWGQQVILHADGYRYTYEVRTNRIVSPSDMSVFKQDGYTWLTLLTCKDYNVAGKIYANRVMVQAVLLKVEADSQTLNRSQSDR